MAGNLFVFPRAIAFDVGIVQPGAKITFTATGTTTPQNTYTDIALTVAHANPVVADSEGLFAQIYLDPTLPDYRVKYTDSSDVLIYQDDDVPASQSGESLTLTGTAPFIDLIETDAAANNTSWRIQVNSEQLKIQVANDALSAFTDILTIDRTANTVDAIALKGTSLSNTGTLSTGEITSSGPVFITEAAASSADVAGDGQFWVENTVPNNPRFTDDSGIDYSLDLVLNRYKETAETRLNTVGIADDADLVFAVGDLAIDTVYKIEIWIIVSCPSATPDIKWKINHSQTPQALGPYAFYEIDEAAGILADVEPFWDSQRNTPLDGTNDKVIKFEGIIHTHATVAGDFRFGWAQNNIDAVNAVTLNIGSWMTATRFGTA